jgi:hypothetical protein
VKGSAVDLVQRCNPVLSKKDKKEIDISLIGLDGVVGKPLFSDQIAEKE